jgi:hypothetical protein
MNIYNNYLFHPFIVPIDIQEILSYCLAMIFLDVNHLFLCIILFKAF